MEHKGAEAFRFSPIEQTFHNPQVVVFWCCHYFCWLLYGCMVFFFVFSFSFFGVVIIFGLYGYFLFFVHFTKPSKTDRWTRHKFVSWDKCPCCLIVHTVQPFICIQMFLSAIHIHSTILIPMTPDITISLSI